MEEKLIIEIIGWLGVVFYVIAYFLLTIGLVKPNGYSFHSLNMLGAAGLITVSAYQSDRPNLVVNVIWFAIGIFAISKRFFASSRQSLKTGTSDK